MKLSITLLCLILAMMAKAMPLPGNEVDPGKIASDSDNSLTYSGESDLAV